MRKVSAFNLAAIVLGIAFLYLPIVVSGDLFVQCLAAGRGVGRLVDALVCELLDDAPLVEFGFDQPPPRAGFGDRGDAFWGRSRRWRWCVSAASAAGSCSPR